MFIPSPQLQSTKRPILTLPNTPSLQNTIFFDNITLIKTESSPQKALILSFNALSLYSSFNNQYQITYEHFINEKEIMALFFLLKYKNPELYNKKLLIAESIYKPYLYENYTYDSFTFKENSDCFKGGIYCVVKSKISGRDSYITGGRIFAIYDSNDITYKNIISNSWDEIITALVLLPNETNEEEMQIVTGCKSGNVKLWKVKSFHIVQFVDCLFKKFGEITKMYLIKDGSNRFIIFDNKKFEIWNYFPIENNSNYRSSLFEITKDGDNNNEILCSNYEYVEKSEEHFLFIADRKQFIYHFELLANGGYVLKKKFFNDNNRPILSLKYYPQRKCLFAGNTILVQIWNCSSDKYEIDSVHFLNDEIHNLFNYVTKNVNYLFCCGKNNLHILHLNP